MPYLCLINLFSLVAHMILMIVWYPFSKPLPVKQKILLSIDCSLTHPESLAATVIRELWEETGLKIANSYDWKRFKNKRMGRFLCK